MIKKGEIYLADLSPIVGSEQGGTRPVLIIQNNIGNKYSPTTIVAAVTTKLDKARLPTHVFLCHTHCGLQKDSVVLLEQIRTIDKSRLGPYIGEISLNELNKVDDALAVSLAVDNSGFNHYY